MSHGTEERDRLVRENEALRSQVAALKAEAERFKAAPCLIDGSAISLPAENPNPVLHFAADGTLLYANAASASLLDQWRCPIGGKPPDDVRQAIVQAHETEQPEKSRPASAASSIRSQLCGCVERTTSTRMGATQPQARRRWLPCGRANNSSGIPLSAPASASR